MPGRGMSNEPNWAGRGGGGHSPPYGIVGETPARRRDDLSPRAESPEMSNKPNLPRFLAENEGRRENKANPSGGEARHWGFRIADCRFGAVEAWNAGAWNVKQTQFAPFLAKNEGRSENKASFCPGGARCEAPMLPPSASRRLPLPPGGWGRQRSSTRGLRGAGDVKQSQFAADFGFRAFRRGGPAAEMCLRFVGGWL